MKNNELKNEGYYIIQLSAAFALTVKQIMGLKVRDITNALKYKEVNIRNKGGKLCSIKVTTGDKKDILKEVLHFTKVKDIKHDEYIFKDTVVDEMTKKIVAIMLKSMKEDRRRQAKNTKDCLIQEKAERGKNE